MWKRFVSTWRGLRSVHPFGLSGALSSDPHIAAHAFSSHHRRLLIQSESCGCFYCLAIYSPVEIVDWTDEADTALCPKCGIDAVIGSKSGYPVTPGFLEKMQEHWFSST
jgi:hypothetical protein